jgi:hypothetical protein
MIYGQTAYNTAGTLGAIGGQIYVQIKYYTE